MVEKELDLKIKILGGDDHNLFVTSETKISEIKRKIELAKSIPYSHQKLIYGGRALLDDKPIGFYSGVLESGKVSLAIIKSDPLKDALNSFFKKNFKEHHSDAVIKAFIADFDKKVKAFSLEDFEKISMASNGP